MNKVLKILLLFIMIGSIFGCANKDKIKKLPGKYIELMQEIEKWKSRYQASEKSRLAKVEEVGSFAF